MASRDLTRLALVGYGNIAQKHLDVFRALGAEVVACCNRSEEGRRRALTEGGIPRAYDAIAPMLEHMRPDGIICCASFPQLFHAAQEILPFGVPTLLEKPPGTSLEQFRTLQTLAETYETPVMVGLNRRHYSVVQKAIEDAGGLERITAVFMEWSEEPKNVLARMSAADVERLVFANSLHGLDLLTTFAGPIRSPAVHTSNLGEPFRWLMAIQGVSTRGVLASFHSTWDSPGRWRASFCVEDRRYVFAPLETCVVMERGKDDRFIEPSPEDRSFKPGFFAQARAFLDVIAGHVVSDLFSLSSAEPAMMLADALTSALCSQACCEPRAPMRVVVSDSRAMPRGEDEKVF